MASTHDEWIDIRSDTVTRPTQQMRKVMTELTYEFHEQIEDPMVTTLELAAAKLMGKEAAVYMPSGVMSNQVAIMAWTQPGDEIITWGGAHIVQLEQGALAILSGLVTRMVESQSGVMTVEEVEPLIRKDRKKGMIGRTSLIEVENSLSNGKVWPLDNLRDIKALAQKNAIPVHMDGARIFNAMTTVGCEIMDISRNADSISFCLSKGLCCPIGSMLVGPADFIQKARSLRNCLGGNFQNATLFAACGIVALNEMIEPLKQDHKIAKKIGQQLYKIRGIEINTKAIESNMIFFRIVNPKYVPQNLIKHMVARKIRMTLPFCEGGDLRIVVHHYIREAQADEIIQALSDYMLTCV